MKQCIAPVGWLQPVQETSCALSQVADTGQPKRPLCQSDTLSGTLLHADRVDSAAGCRFTDMQRHRDRTLRQGLLRMTSACSELCCLTTSSWQLMQAEELQRVKNRLRRIQDRLEELEEELEEELLKDIPDQTKLKRLKEVMELRIAAEKRLLIEWDRLEPLPEGEQWGPAPDAWWQAAHLVLGPSSILLQEDRLPPEFPGSSGGCGGSPAGLDSISRGRGHALNRAPKSTGCVH